MQVHYVGYRPRWLVWYLENGPRLRLGPFSRYQTATSDDILYLSHALTGDNYYLSALGLINGFVSRYTWYDWAAGAERCSQNDRKGIQHTDTILPVPLIKDCGKIKILLIRPVPKGGTMYSFPTKRKKESAWTKQESLNSEHRDNNFWWNKPERKGQVECWNHSCCVLCSYFYRSFVVPLLRSPSSDCSRRRPCWTSIFRKNERNIERQIKTQSGKWNSCPTRMFTQQWAQKSLDIGHAQRDGFHLLRKLKLVVFGGSLCFFDTVEDNAWDVPRWCGCRNCSLSL